jgi:hypothetical protein
MIGCYHLVSVQALKDKLMQFPPSTAFVFKDARSPYSEILDDTLGRQIVEWGAAHGRQITLAPNS